MDLSNKTDLNTLRDEMNAALSQIAEKHGLTLHAGNIRYEGSGDRCTVKVTAERAGAESKEAVAFREQIRFYSEAMSADDLGKTFRLHGTAYRIEGLKTRARKRPILIRDVANDKLLVCDVRMGEALVRSTPVAA